MSLLGVEPQILARLRERIDATVPVLAAPALDEVAAQAQPPAAIYLIYSGGAVAEARGDGRAVRIAQRWTVLVSARNVAGMADGAAARADAGTLADAVLVALMGWQPEGASAPLVLADLPEPGYLYGTQWVPAVFTTEIVRRVVPGA